MFTYYSGRVLVALLPLAVLTASVVAKPLPGRPLAKVTHIGAVQQQMPIPEGNTYLIEGTVTGVYAGLSPAGFFVQERPGATDDNPATSDAVFVAQPNPIVQVGDRVRVEGVVQKVTVAPAHEQPIITKAQVTVVEVGTELPSFTPISTSVFSAAELMPYINRRVEFSIPLTVSEVYSLRSKGELLLSAGGKLYQPTQFIDPNDSPATGTSSKGTSNVEAVQAMQRGNYARSIVLDNGSSSSATVSPPFLDPFLHTVRIGSTITHLRGILSFDGGKWRVHTIGGQASAPHFKVKRPAVPNFGQVDVKLASFNVLNYFNGDGQGGGFPSARGARSAEEFARQRSKIITALAAINADIVGLTEIENDGTGPSSALQDLVSGLNATLGKGTYAFVNDGGAEQQPNNTDAIHNALIYKPSAVKLLGPALIDHSENTFERPPIAQVFSVPYQGHTEKLAVVVNHFKSKISGTGEDADQNDGQGGSNSHRCKQAAGLISFIKNQVLPTGASRVVSIGDYNANYEEDPIDMLRAAGLVVATPPTSASYVFRGFTGSLDHCIITSSLVGFIDVQKWNINSYEPTFLEYGQAGAATDVSSPFRSSDHDPVLMGIRFMGIAGANQARIASNRLLTYTATGADIEVFQLAKILPPGSKELSMEFYLLEGQPMVRMQGSPEILQAELGNFTAHLAPGIYQLKLKGKGFDIAQQVVKE
ncbi:MAG: ExeM/NucH family extracellular endonuclease [Hymenobacter sp.]|nr:MAG: ExeM/NucH family extracellular endonuclease [Hymenobacter sp.]